MIPCGFFSQNLFNIRLPLFENVFFFSTFTFSVSSGGSLPPLGCGNNPEGGFMFPSAGPRKFQVFHFGISISCNDVKSDSTFMHGPTRGCNCQQNFFSTLSMKKNDQLPWAEGKIFLRPPFTRRVPDLCRSLSVRSFSPVNSGHVLSPPPLL